MHMKLRSLAAHLLLCGPVPNRPQTGTGGLGTPDIESVWMAVGLSSFRI